MRDIKFNIWHPEDKELHGPFSLQDIANKNIPSTLYQNDGITFGAPLKDALIWLQYSGVKDKNGIDIYEGDIGALFDADIAKDVYGKVEFTEGCFTLLIKGAHYTQRHNLNLVNLGLKIVGNVFENAELGSGANRAYAGHA